MQSVSSRIWTRIVVSISYHDNHYTMGTSIYLCVSKWLIFDRRITDTEQHFEPFNHVQIKLLVQKSWHRLPVCKIELLLLHRNTFFDRV